MEKKEVASRSILNPKPPVVVSCRGNDGKDNALVVAYACNCSYDPPMLMVGIVPSRHSWKLIKESGCFVVNLADSAFRPAWEILGSESGRDQDKLARAGVATTPAEAVAACLLADCPVNIECTVVDSLRTGSHEMFVGRIEKVHARADLVLPDGKVDWAKADLLAY